MLEGDEMLNLDLTTIVSIGSLGFGLLVELLAGSNILTFGIGAELLSRSAGNGDKRGGILGGFSDLAVSLLSDFDEDVLLG